MGMHTRTEGVSDAAFIGGAGQAERNLINGGGERE